MKYLFTYKSHTGKMHSSIVEGEVAGWQLFNRLKDEQPPNSDIEIWGQTELQPMKAGAIVENI